VTDIASTRRVRPWLRRFFIIAVVLLLPVAIHGIWDQSESTLLAREIAKVAQRGEPVSLAFQRYPLPSADQRRAARLYASAGDLAGWRIHERWENGYTAGIEDAVDRAFASGDAAPVLNDLDGRFLQREPALPLLDEASGLDFAGFSSIAPSLYENASPLVALSDLNCLRAEVLTARGDGNGAADTLVESVRLQRTQSKQFYRYLARRRLYGSLRLLLHYAAPDAPALSRLQQAVEKLSDEDDLAEQLQIARAHLLGDFWPYPAGGPSWTLRPRMVTRGVLDSLSFELFRPLFTHEMRQQFAPFEDAISVARQPWPGKFDASRELLKRYGVGSDLRPRSVLQRAMGSFVPPAVGVWTLENYLPIAGISLAMRRTAITALAVERFRRAHAGAAPSTLDALVPDYLAAVPQDPFSGQPLRYRLGNDSYVVYSVDANKVDDGGALYGFGSGSQSPARRANDPSPRDIGIRVPLHPLH
jgi:hypothetical protein